MKSREAKSMELGIAVLHLFERAMVEGRPSTAEHLMRALEELASSDPACKGLVECAYLGIPFDGADSSRERGCTAKRPADR